ncbi:MAG TPA: hypothetical protein EYQ50_10540 [Verrucomicrobiales bacterium]|nr:hypothetical protein [Verrucomicrobiales bacterium]
MSFPHLRSRPILLTTLAVTCMALGTLGHFLWQHVARPADSSHWHRVPGTPLRVEARGSGRAWRFTYSGRDGVLGTGDDRVSDNHLRLPAGVDVVIQLRSDDFIYVFSCPGLKLKEIAVPDLEFSIAFRVDRRGDYDLVMDPMCGFQLPPGETMGTLGVASETDFRLWLRDRTNLITVHNKTSQ